MLETFYNDTSFVIIKWILLRTSVFIFMVSMILGLWWMVWKLIFQRIPIVREAIDEILLGKKPLKKPPKEPSKEKPKEHQRNKTRGKLHNS